jgi:pimeloyl-ACP methyl ester carboxylesterase
MQTSQIRVAILLLSLAIVAGCARLPRIEKTSIKANTVGDLQVQLQKRPASLETFRYSGPFDVAIRSNHALHLSDTEYYGSDLYLASHPGRVPLVIFLHGNEATKELHAYQAMHVASWGVHALTVQLPNQGPWAENARILGRIVRAIRAGTLPIDHRIDTARIILAGHSYGAAAVSIALAEGAPAIGGLLLDPAAITKGLPQSLARIQTPVMILGADEQVTRTNNREYFYFYIRGGVFEISVKDATHEDAQFPSNASSITEALQITFAGALAASALSLHMNGSFDYAWASFEPDVRGGKLLRARKK